jgi:hypothetical protein
MAVFWRHYASDPVVRAIQGVPLDLPVSLNGRVDRNMVRRTGFHADILRPQGIADVLNANIRVTGLPGGYGRFRLQPLGARRGE